MRRPQPLVLVFLLIGALLAAAVAWGGIESHWSGGTDSANTLEVAKNLLAGRGFTVDHLHYYAPAFPGISHPENAYPLLHPTLVAALGLVTGDVFVGAHLLQALFVLLYFGVLPALALRRLGPAAAVALLVTLFALEQPSLFDRPLNDSGAMVLFALAASEGMHALRPASGPAQRWVWLRAALLFALAAAFKPSTAFVALGWLAGMMALGGGPRRVAVGRALLVLGAIALFELPVLVWYHGAHGWFGLPHEAAMRNFVRAIPPGADFWSYWERSRTYFPAHPELPTSLGELLRQKGAWQALLVDPVLRMADAGYHAFVRGEVLGPGWVLLLGIGGAFPRPSLGARLALSSMLGALLIAGYSHYEPRYFYALRPLMAFFVMEAAERASRDPRDDASRWGVRGYAALVLVSAAGIGAGWYWAVDLVWLLAFGLFLLAKKPRGLSADHLPFAVALTLLGLFSSRVPRSANVFFDMLGHRVEKDAVIGRFVARNVPQTDAVMSRRRGLSLFAERKTVVTPYHTADVCRAAVRYQVGWLLITPDDLEKQPDLGELTRALPRVARQRDLALYRLRCEGESG